MGAAANGAANAILKQRANIIAAGKVARQSTRLGFKYTQGVQASIYGNLTTTLAGVSGAMTGEQNRQMSALQTLAANQKAGATRISARSDRAVRTAYGSAIGGANAENQRAVVVAGKAGGKTVQAQVAAGGILARGNTAAMTTLGQGVQMAQAGAAAQTATALAYRAKNDATLQAQSTLALQEMVLQNKLDLQNYQAKLDMQNKADQKIANGEMTGVASVAGNSAAGLFQNFRDYVDSQGNQYAPDQVVVENGIATATTTDGTKVTVTAPTANMAATAYMTDNGIDPASNQGQVIASIARAMASSGAGAQPGGYHEVAAGSAIRDAVNQQMAILYPNFSKYQDTIDGIVTSAIAGVGPSPHAPGSDGTPAGMVNIDTGLSWFDELKYRIVHPFKVAAHVLSPSYYLHGEPLTDTASNAHVSTITAAIGLLVLGTTPDMLPVTAGALPPAALLGLPAGTAATAEGVTAAVSKLSVAQRALRVVKLLIPGVGKVAEVAPAVASMGVTDEMIAAARAGGPSSSAYKALLQMVQNATS